MNKTLKQFKTEFNYYSREFGFYLKNKFGVDNTGEVISILILIGMIIMCIAIMIDAFFIGIQRVFFG